MTKSPNLIFDTANYIILNKRLWRFRQIVETFLEYMNLDVQKNYDLALIKINLYCTQPQEPHTARP